MMESRNTYKIYFYKNKIVAHITEATFNGQEAAFAEKANYLKQLFMAAGYDQKFDSFMMFDDVSNNFIKLNLVE